MALMDNNRLYKTAASAAAAAPYVRRLMGDERLRSDLRTLISSATRLYNELSSDDTVEKLLKDDKIVKDIDRILESVQKAGQRAMAQRRGTNWVAIAIVGGVAGGIAALLVYPRTRRGLQSGVQTAYTTVRRSGPQPVEDVQQQAA